MSNLIENVVEQLQRLNDRETHFEHSLATDTAMVAQQRFRETQLDVMYDGPTPEQAQICSSVST